jgi:lipoyl(octanoyl) transferase
MAEWQGGVWHLWIDATPRPGYANMSLDLALLDRSQRYGEQWLRLYRWQPFCLSFGRHEPAARRYDQQRIHQLGLDTVRRPTGGRAVWHATELTYAVTGPVDAFDSARSAYVQIHQVMLAALGALGVEGTLAPVSRSSGVGAGPCFSRPAGGEVLVQGRKAVGSAQLSRGSGLLQHGSILLEDAQYLVESLQCGPQAPARQAPSPRYPLGRSVDVAAVTAAVVQSAKARWTGSWNQWDEPQEVLHAAAGYFPHFQSAAWTWTR